jgi:hypothetical protein
VLEEFHDPPITDFKKCILIKNTYWCYFSASIDFQLLFPGDIETKAKCNLFQTAIQNKPLFFSISNTSFSSLDFADTIYLFIYSLQS